MAQGVPPVTHRQLQVGPLSKGELRERILIGGCERNIEIAGDDKGIVERSELAAFFIGAGCSSIPDSFAIIQFATRLGTCRNNQWSRRA